jgi:hypothetical protein
MSRSMKWGLATIVATFAVGLMVTEDAEARHRRRGRHHRGGCCGYVAQSYCAPVSHTACAPACGVATNACPGGVCGVAGDVYSGGHSSGYGAASGVMNGYGAYGQPTPALNGDTFRADQGRLNGAQNGAAPNGAARSPSDRPPAPPAPADAPNGSAAQPDAPGTSSAPPPPPQDQ